MKVWLDGNIMDGSEARIPVTDHGFLYGDGVFDSLRVRRGKVFRIDDHVARLMLSARAVGLEPPGGHEALRTAVLDTARAFGRADSYLRLIVSRGDGPLGINPARCPRARIVSPVRSASTATTKPRRDWTSSPRACGAPRPMCSTRASRASTT